VELIEEQKTEIAAHERSKNYFHEKYQHWGGITTIGARNHYVFEPDGK
jgi:hypothetical protein